MCVVCRVWPALQPSGQQPAASSQQRVAIKGGGARSQVKLLHVAIMGGLHGLKAPGVATGASDMQEGAPSVAGVRIAVRVRVRVGVLR